MLTLALGFPVPAKRFYRNSPIAEFQALAATGSNEAASLPTGLVFHIDGAGSCSGAGPREVCGTPVTLTANPQTVTAAAQDADANRAVGDRDPLTFQVSVLARPTLAGLPVGGVSGGIAR